MYFRYINAFCSLDVLDVSRTPAILVIQVDTEMVTIAFINQKGGVAKTTSAVEIASRFARSGKRTLCIDADPQANMTYIYGINPDREGQRSLKDVFSKEAEIIDVVQRSAEGPDVVPNNILMSNADRMFVGVNSMTLLRNAIRPVAGSYDVCIIDSPPTLGMINWNVLIAADYAVVPVNANALSIQGLRALSETVAEVREEANPGLRILGLLITRYNPRTKLGREALPDLEMIATRYLDTIVFQSKIRQSVAVEDAQANRMSTASSRRSKIASDYDALFGEIVSELRKKGGSI